MARPSADSVGCVAIERGSEFGKNARLAIARQLGKACNAKAASSGSMRMRAMPTVRGGGGGGIHERLMCSTPLRKNYWPARTSFHIVKSIIPWLT